MGEGQEDIGAQEARVTQGSSQLTRRNFIALARVLNSYKGKMDEATHIALVNDFATEFKQFNPLFNMEKFCRTARE